MIRTELTRAYFKLHIAVFLFGLTAILGKVISLEQIGLVWNRLWISFLGLILLPGVIHSLKKFTLKEFLTFGGIGIIVALHWITFYGSIKLGNSASIALACLATTPLFTSVIEPLITKRKLLKSEVLLGLMTIVGVYFIAGVGSFYYPAMISGIISALLASTFSTLNKRFGSNHPSISVSFLELFSGWVFISLMLPFYYSFEKGFHLFPENTMQNEFWHFTFYGVHSDWFYLFLLGIFCTSLAFVLALQALKYLTAFTSNLSINLEPVYGIILAAILFGENNDLNFEFYLGTGIILSCVFLHAILMRKNRVKKMKAEGMIKS